MISLSKLPMTPNATNFATLLGIEGVFYQELGASSRIATTSHYKLQYVNRCL
jgi:hypothetical protein